MLITATVAYIIGVNIETSETDTEKLLALVIEEADSGIRENLPRPVVIESSISEQWKVKEK